MNMGQRSLLHVFDSTSNIKNTVKERREHQTCPYILCNECVWRVVLLECELFGDKFLVHYTCSITE